VTSRKGPRKFFFRPPAGYYDMPEEERHRWLEELRQEIVTELDEAEPQDPADGSAGRDKPTDR
jgi:hypothetical protein